MLPLWNHCHFVVHWNNPSWSSPHQTSIYICNNLQSPVLKPIWILKNNWTMSFKCHPAGASLIEWTQRWTNMKLTMLRFWQVGFCRKIDFYMKLIYIQDKNLTEIFSFNYILKVKQVTWIRGLFTSRTGLRSVHRNEPLELPFLFLLGFSLLRLLSLSPLHSVVSAMATYVCSKDRNLSSLLFIFPL